MITAILAKIIENLLAVLWSCSGHGFISSI